MSDYSDLASFFKEKKLNVIIAAEGETRTHSSVNNEVVLKTPAGGVSVAFDTLATAAQATYIARGRTPEDLKMVDKHGKVTISADEGSYTLKRLFIPEEDINSYYFGFSNQTLWPLCHVAFEKPLFREEWYAGYTRVNRLYAQAIKDEIRGKSGKTFVWINDYQLALVPAFLGKQKDVTVGFFWHIPWPTWEIFRILPHKKDILWSLLSCDFLAFHRGYQVRNFLSTVDNELEVRIDHERHKVHFDKNVLTVMNLPMGLDTEVIRSHATVPEDSFITSVIQQVFGIKAATQTNEKKKETIHDLFEKYQVILGIDRLDYTKGLPQRLDAIDIFLERNPKYIGKVLYLGIMAPSRDQVPSYKALRKEVERKAIEINRKYKTGDWTPLHLIYKPYEREDIIEFYKKAKLCLVTPLDDGMNLVSKEFVTVAATTKDPGMLVLSQFAGSAIDLSSALIVNPYDTESVSDAMLRGLTMSQKEKRERMENMVTQLNEHNIYEWAKTFTKESLNAARENTTQKSY